MKNRDQTLHVAMFPWLAMGHLLPFLRLSQLLARKGHKISFVSTPRNLARLPKLPPHLSKVTFVPLSLPPVPGLPPDAESSVDVPHNKQQRLKAAFDLLQPQVTEFLHQTYPDWIIYDFTFHWLPKIAADLNVSKAYFSPITASSLCFLGPPSGLIAGSRSTPEDFTMVPRWINFESNVALRLYEVTRPTEKTEEDYKNGPSDFIRFGVSIGESDAVFVRSSPEFEPECFGLLRELYQKPVIPVGFLPPVREEEVERDNDDDDKTWVSIKEWLDEQRVNSVVYVSLGTEATLTREELGKLALGLEISMLPFFWALRNGQGRAKSDSDMLPEGFEERVKGRGTIHVGWVPQIKILSHESVGGFLTHCGWNSLIEGLGFGRVPIIFPVVNEQGLNARLLHGKKLGVEIPRDEIDGSFSSDSVADSVRLAMVDKKGEDVRARAKEAKGLFGSRDKNMRYVDEFVEYLKFEEGSSPSC